MLPLQARVDLGAMTMKWCSAFFQAQTLLEPHHQFSLRWGILTHMGIQLCCIPICRCMQKHIQHNKDERTHFFRKIYFSHFIERVVCERELETEQRLQHIDPKTLLAITAFLSRFPGCSNGGLGAQILLGHGSHSSIFSPTDLNFLLPGLYNNLTSIYFLRASQFHTLFNPSTVKVTPDLLISSTGCTCYLHRCISSFDSLAGLEVNMYSTASQPTEKDILKVQLKVIHHQLQQVTL